MDLNKGGLKLGPSSSMVNVAKSPKLKIKKAGSDGEKRQINYLLFGEGETGKTSVAANLAASSHKVFVLFTDLGEDNGISGAQVYANLKKSSDLFKENVGWAPLSYEEVNKFLDNPESIIEGFWEFNPDFIIWDGFSFHQQMNILPEVEEDINKGDSPEGKFDTYQGWGVTKNRTIRAIDNFLSIRNPSGKPLHKIVTTAVKYGSEKVGPDKSEVRAKHEPDISGAASRIMRFGFDVVFETIRSGEKFEYAMNISAATKRRFSLPEKMEADFTKLHNNVLSQVN